MKIYCTDSLEVTADRLPRDSWPDHEVRVLQLFQQMEQMEQLRQLQQLQQMQQDAVDLKLFISTSNEPALFAQLLGAHKC